MLATWTRISVPASVFGSVVPQHALQRQDRRVLLAVHAGGQRERRPRPRAVDDADRDGGALVSGAAGIVSVPDTVVPGGADRAPIVKGCCARAGALSRTPATASVPVSLDRCIDTSSSCSKARRRF